MIDDDDDDDIRLYNTTHTHTHIYSFTFISLKWIKKEISKMNIDFVIIKKIM